MSTETKFYRVRRRNLMNTGFCWLSKEDGYWKDEPGLVWTDLESAREAAKDSHGKVITVRHKLIPADQRPHDRAWALRQLAKGRSVTHTEWAPGKRVCVTSKGLRELPGDFVCELVPPDGYTLWQEPAK